MWQEVLPALQARLRRLEDAWPTLRIERRFAPRVEALEELELEVLDRVENIVYQYGYHEELALVQRRAERLWQRLTAIDTHLFRRLRAQLVASRNPAETLRQLFAAYIGEATPVRDAVGYDCLDVFIDALFDMHTEPVETAPLQVGMIGYQATPAHVILDMLRRVPLGADDVFYDIGAGIGRVVLLVGLLSTAQVKGIEYEPAYCAYAQARAAELRLTRVSFCQGDARQEDYSDGTVFFLYTPFRGAMLHQVLGRLHDVAGRRPITIATYGPCTLSIAQAPWLQAADGHTQHDDRTLSIFRSRE
jgi:hypothetical protein